MQIAISVEEAQRIIYSFLTKELGLSVYGKKENFFKDKHSPPVWFDRDSGIFKAILSGFPTGNVKRKL